MYVLDIFCFYFCVSFVRVYTFLIPSAVPEPHNDHVIPTRIKQILAGGFADWPLIRKVICVVFSFVCFYKRTSE